VNTGAFVTFLQNRINGEYSRAEILEMVNNAQNEILSKECALVRIIPDPYVHTGSASYTGHTSSNASGAGSFTVNETIAATVPTSGFLLVTESAVTTKYEYVSYSGSVFTLANGVTLSSSYTSSATATVDAFELIASGALFSSIANRTTQWDIRKVQRVYAFASDDSRYLSYGGADINSYRPDVMKNANSYDWEVSVDAVESQEPDSKDAKIIFWRENAPGVTTADYMAEAYRWPDQLTVETVAITIPARFHTNLLYYAVLKDIEYEEYGSADRPMQLYDKYLKEFLDEVNRGATTEQRQTLPNW